MKFTVIGYWGAYPEKESATSCYVLETEEKNVVIDLGSGALSRLFRHYELEDLDAVVLSHFHHDHIADLGSLQYALLVQQHLNDSKTKIPIYAAKDNKKDFERLTHNGTIGKAYQEGRELHIGEVMFSFLRTKHPKPCYAMRMTDGERTIVYTADTSYFSGLVDFARDADLLVAETSFYQGMDGKQAGHLTSEEVGKLASKANVGELWLTHLPHFGDHQDLVKEAQAQYNGNIQLASEGLSFGKVE